MYLENGRDISRGILLLICTAIAFWVDLTTGLVLISLTGVMILQSAFTNWGPADLLLRPLGLKPKLDSEAKKPERVLHANIR